MGDWRGVFAFVIVLIVLLLAASWLIREAPDLTQVLSGPGREQRAPDGASSSDAPGAPLAAEVSEVPDAAPPDSPPDEDALDAATIAAAVALAAERAPARALSAEEACEGLGGEWHPESRGWCDLPLPSAAPVSDTAVLEPGMQIPCPQPLEKILEQVVAEEVGGDEMRIYLLFRSVNDDLEELVVDEETSVDVKSIGDGLRRVEEDMRARAALQRVDLDIDSFLPMQSWPADGELRSGFGMRVHPVTRYWSMHNGADISGDTGDPVVAALAGEVLSAQECPFYGNMVVMYHGAGLATLYAHLDTLAVAPDDEVEAGEALGTVGATGRATGPHLHFEARVDGAAVDPVPFLP